MSDGPSAAHHDQKQADDFPQPIPTKSPVKKQGVKLNTKGANIQSISTDTCSPQTLSNKVEKDRFNKGRWTKEEHVRFMEGLKLYGKDWKKVQEYVGTRSSTQARSHAQKVLPKLGNNIEIPSPVSRKDSIKSEQSFAMA